MARLEFTPLSAWIRYYSDFGTSSLERMQEAIEHLENETYTTEKFFSDAALFWADATNGWWTAMRQTASGPVPTVFIKVRHDEQFAAEGNIAVDAKEGTLERTPPIRLGDSALRAAGTAPMGKNNVDVEWHPGKKHCLRVCVRRILVPEDQEGMSENELKLAAEARANTPKFVPGVYQSLVHMNGKLLATVTILVQEPDAKAV